MAKRGKKGKSTPGGDAGSSRDFFILDKFKPEEIPKWKDRRDEILRFHYDFYQDLQYKRKEIRGELTAGLHSAAERFEFEKFQRVLRYRWSLQPLSPKGSVKTIPGGRFNIGPIDPVLFPPFPALYISSDRDTGMQELFCQKLRSPGVLQAHELALANPDSISSIAVRGMLASVIDLRNETSLEGFAGALSGLEVASSLKRKAKSLGIARPRLVRTVKGLLKELLTQVWRAWPMQFNVPSSSQIFGRMARDAGIAGIVYPSKFTGEACLAVFPQTFSENGSYLELQGRVPKEVNIKRLDGAAWEDFRKECE